MHTLQYAANEKSAIGRQIIGRLVMHADKHQAAVSHAHQHRSPMEACVVSTCRTEYPATETLGMNCCCWTLTQRSLFSISDTATRAASQLGLQGRLLC